MHIQVLICQVSYENNYTNNNNKNTINNIDNNITNNNTIIIILKKNSIKGPTSRP